MMSANKILLATDLDRTLLPNGPQPESPRARELFAEVASRPEVTLVYVSGRSRDLQERAISEYGVPQPDYSIADVGSSILEPHHGWRRLEAWDEDIGEDWAGRGWRELAQLLEPLDELERQEEDRQSDFKLSFYTPPEIERGPLLERVGERLKAAGVRPTLIWSLDEAENVGLLDVLPARASKVKAIRFLMGRLAFGERHTVVAGDSGNDLDALSSGLQAVLVANARAEVREEAVARAEANGTRDRLYLARGELEGLNGNYAAGVLEGLVHFIPAAAEWIGGNP